MFLFDIIIALKESLPLLSSFYFCSVQLFSCLLFSVILLIGDLSAHRVKGTIFTFLLFKCAIFSVMLRIGFLIAFRVFYLFLKLNKKMPSNNNFDRHKRTPFLFIHFCFREISYYYVKKGQRFLNDLLKWILMHFILLFL